MIYGSFAQIYDKFIDMPYRAWADYVQAIWRRFDCDPQMVLDLACGTGGLTAVLAGHGYEMIGIDISSEMLAIAQQKDAASLYLQQDIREFELYGTVDAIVCVCDGFNYLVDDGDLEQTLALCANYLNPGGLLIFDINTEYKFSKILADNTFGATCEDAAYIWENFYDAEEKINEYAITCFVEESGAYRRFEELHTQRAYSREEILSALGVTGFGLLSEYEELTFDAPGADSQRVFYVARAKKNY